MLANLSQNVLRPIAGDALPVVGFRALLHMLQRSGAAGGTGRSSVPASGHSDAEYPEGVTFIRGSRGGLPERFARVVRFLPKRAWVP